MRERLDAVSIADAHRLASRIGSAHDLAALDAVAADIDTAAARLEAHRSQLPTPTFPAQLPVSARHDEIAAAIAAHQVIVIAGETGSGKTTQIPKICLELGRGVRGMIGHTQPRRLAARTVAARIADELDVPLGAQVGYAVRFDDKTSESTAIKLMTDGLLLNEIRRDRLLRSYDTIIIDEAHERSLNIDFLLGYLAAILPKRPDLKVIITSATIDPDRFATHFAAADGTPAPVIEVSGRTYPVELRYRPLETEHDGKLQIRDEIDALTDAVSELVAAGDGDILVFLSGEREIRDAEEALRGSFPALDIFPLFSRLSVTDQHKAFRTHARRRVVLATNIAETSVTVPGIHYVIDTGLARISRYSTRTKVQRLPIEPVSQASANQRAGRCGRVTAGICIRLYSEDDYSQRPAFTDPEILRTNLASVILQMADLGLGAVADFPFVDTPDARAIRDGHRLLVELGAIREHTNGAVVLTTLGREIAALPLDPRLARMLAAGHRNRALAETIIIVAALTVGDVRERPAEQRDQAASLHARFTDRSSDFLGYLNVWRYVSEQRAELSGSAFRRMCHDEFLHWLRIREWQDLCNQLTTVCREHGWHAGSLSASDDDIHRSILAGLLSSIGTRKEESRDYAGARGITFTLHPSSATAKKPPAWVMAAELVETSRLFARDVARIDPTWVEPLAGHMVKRSYTEPHWSRSRGTAMAYERVTLLGLPIVERRPIMLSRVDAPLAHELFVRHGLVEGQWRTASVEIHHNQQLREQATELQQRARRSDTVIDDEHLVAWYLERIPDSVVSGRHFESWLKQASPQQREALLLAEADVYVGARKVSAADYPPKWRQGELTFDLHYTHNAQATTDGDATTDGVTVLIPLAHLGQVRSAGFEWLVPGMREELYTELLRTLPKMYRRLVSPQASFAAVLAEDLTPRAAPLVPALAQAVSARIGTTIAPAEFSPDALPRHLHMHFAVIDASGAQLDSDYSLAALQQRQAARAHQQLVSSLVDDHSPVHQWTADTVGDIAEEVTDTVNGVTVTAYPAIEVRDDGIHRTVCTTKSERTRAMTRAVIELLRHNLVSPTQLLKGRDTRERLALTQYPWGGVEALAGDATVVTVGRIIAAHGGAPLTAVGFAELTRAVRAQAPGAVSRMITAVLPALVELQRFEAAHANITDPHIAAQLRDEVTFLLGRGFFARHSPQRLEHLDRHMRSVLARVDIATQSPARYSQLHAKVAPSEQLVDDAIGTLATRPRGARSAKELQWMLAELRVSVFTQRLGTDGPISAPRIAAAVSQALAPSATTSPGSAGSAGSR